MRRPATLLPLFALVLALLGGPALATRAQDASPAASPGALPPLVADFGAAWSSGDPEQVVALYTDDAHFEEVVLGGVVTRSSDEMRAYLTDLFAAFSGFALTPTAGFVAGDRAALEWVVRGNYAGEFGGMPPGTGQSVEFRGASILELADGQITRDSEYWDAATLLSQVGALPGAATPAP